MKNTTISILLIFLFSLIYSYPNIYGEDPAVIIEDIKNENVILNIINNKNIKIKSLKKNNNNLIIRLNSTEDQFNLFENIKKIKNIKIHQNILLSEKISLLEKIKAYPMKLGLDLRGGVHLTIKINYNNNIATLIKNNFILIKKNLTKNDLKYKNIKILKKKIYIKLYDLKDKIIIENLINKTIKNIKISYSKNLLILELDKKYLSEIKNNIITKTLSVLTNRINELGLSETIIHLQGKNKISIDLPGIQNIDYAKKILGKTASLDFMLLEEKFNKKKSKILYDKNNNPIILKNKSILKGDSIKYATSGFENTFNRPCVNIKIDEKKVKNFKEKTKKNIGKYLAIIYKENYLENNNEIINEKIISIATIKTELGEQFQITGLTTQESKDLAILIRSGSLPTTISIIEEKIIGPSLGEDNIYNSIKSFIISYLIISLFMLIKYKKLGIISNIGLLMNMTLLISIMSIIGITLTLSGMAGIILTIGMSIDSNILIFERIKEEAKKLSNINQIIQNGFKNALSSILDANITTLLMALILLIFGAGPIKGFSITLSIGILTSMYTSLFVTKNIIKILIEKKINLL